MQTERYFKSTRVALTGALLAMFFLSACQQTQQPAPSAAESKAAPTEKVFIEFRGPWAFVPDPKDAKMLLAIAPKAKGHRDLFVQASNESTLGAGVYELSVPAHSGTVAATADPDIARADIDAQRLQRALDNKTARYVIRLPMPEAYVIASRHRIRLDTSYPPDASKEKNFATAISLRYDVSSRNGFSLAGTPDRGTFNPLLLEVETPMIRFVIIPGQFDDPNDKCNSHSRESFRALTALLALKLYVDIPNDPADCHGKDPQNRQAANAEGGSLTRFERLLALLTENLAEVQGANAANIGRGIPDYQHAAMYLFGLPTLDCIIPIVMLRPVQAAPNS
ncbi:MAG: hypothetical protein WCB11_20215 [Terriglobales bacterium]